jgi:SacI homology domain
LDKFFLVLSTAIFQIGIIEQSEIYHPITMAFLPLEVKINCPIDNKIEKDLLNSPNIGVISQYIQNLRQLLVFGHYFSYNYDLTVSKQAKAGGKSLDSRFLWNKGMTRDFKKYKISSSWVLPLIEVLKIIFI